MALLNIDLINNTDVHPVYAYVTGLDLNKNNAWALLKSDGRSLYYPSSPPQPLAPLTEDCAIELAPHGRTRTIQVPQMAGARIWFSMEQRLTFFINPGPAIVMPSVTNPTDPNINIRWAFAEFTYNPAQLFANISYVDFFSIPVSMTLRSTSQQQRHISGTGSNGLDEVTREVLAQNNKDNVGWDKLVFRDSNGVPLRVLSPNCAMNLHPELNLFHGYFVPLVDRAWQFFRDNDLTVDTQAAAGVVRGRVVNGVLQFPQSSFSKPDTRAIFDNSSGPFATGGVSPEALALIPRLAAALNRSTLLLDGTHPVSFDDKQYYRSDPTNHYAR